MWPSLWCYRRTLSTSWEPPSGEGGGAEGRERKKEQKEERLFKVNSEKPWIPNKEHLSIKDTWFCPILIVPSRGIAINKEHFQFPKGVSGFTV